MQSDDDDDVFKLIKKRRKSRSGHDSAEMYENLWDPILVFQVPYAEGSIYPCVT